MTREELEALLSHLDADREEAGRKYVEIRHRLIRLYEWRNVRIAAEDVADETINRVARKLQQGTVPAHTFGYFSGVAHLVYKELLRKPKGDHFPDDWPDDRRHEEEEEQDPRLELIRQCLERLPEDQRTLVLQYHQGEHNIQTRKDLAERLGLPLNALRIRVHRIRKKIEECVEARGRH
jgi:RNA polymerase sigma factor (sigma-70 family)